MPVLKLSRRTVYITMHCPLNVEFATVTFVSTTCERRVWEQI